MKMYRADYSGIKELEVIKETPMTVTFIETYRIMLSDKFGTCESTERKNSSWASWHSSFDEAESYLILQEEKAIENHLKSIQYRKEKIEEIKSYRKTIKNN